MRYIVILLGALLAGCGGGSSVRNDPAPTPVLSSAVEWSHHDPVAGDMCCFYAPIVVKGDTLRVYSNSTRGHPNPEASGEDGVYTLRMGTLVQTGEPQIILRTPPGPDAYIRTSGVVERDGQYYALLFTGDAYPGTNGYSPSWATSPDGLTWTWHGKVTERGMFASSNALVMTDRTDSYRFLSWVDGAGLKLALMHSADGLSWIVDPDEKWPAELSADTPVFPSATRTPYGYHLIAADGYPAKHHRHLFSCDGMTWRVLEREAPTISFKSTNLAYDAGIVHAIVLGDHWSFPAKAFGC